MWRVTTRLKRVLFQLQPLNMANRKLWSHVPERLELICMSLSVLCDFRSLANHPYALLDAAWLTGAIFDYSAGTRQWRPLWGAVQTKGPRLTSLLVDSQSSLIKVLWSPPPAKPLLPSAKLSSLRPIPRTPTHIHQIHAPSALARSSFRHSQPMQLSLAAASTRT